MKKQIIIAAAIIAATSFTNQLTAQEVAAAKIAGYDLKKNVKCRISSTSSGCDISFTNEVKSPRDAASGMATGKRQHKPFRFSVSAADNSVEESSGNNALRESPTKASTAAGKASFSDLSVMITIKGKSQKLDITDGEFSLPPDCPNGACAMSVSWSWGATNSSSKSCSVDFLLEIEDGVCKQVAKSKSNVKNN